MRERLTAAHLAGWLFADLLLVLFLVSLSAQPSPPPPVPAVSSSPTPPPTAVPTPEPAPARLLSKDYCELLIRADFGPMLGSGPARTAEERRVVRRVDAVLAGRDPEAVLGADPGPCREHLRRDRQAGIIIAYGAAPRSSIGPATQVAKRVSDAVIAGQPRFAGATALAQWTEQGTDRVKMIVFFYEQ
ncbi:hypothetical protein AB0J63_23585 [Streptosporangium canum]|uniref:hypothetical protein n=1 Tax=Streptosporangium canum TaxID=324952 RepID=UPI00343FCE9E